MKKFLGVVLATLLLLSNFAVAAPAYSAPKDKTGYIQYLNDIKQKEGVALELDSEAYTSIYPYVAFTMAKDDFNKVLRVEDNGYWKTDITRGMEIGGECGKLGDAFFGNASFNFWIFEKSVTGICHF